MAQQYAVWMEAQQMLADLPYGMHWKTVSNRQYLYQVADRAGNAISLGPRSPETERILEQYAGSKAGLKSREEQSGERLRETCGIYRSLRLPMIAPEAVKILREADRRQMLGSQIIVVGTNAMAAYSIEANGFISAPAETQDFDITWTDETADTGGAPLWSMLKAVDSTYTVNTERNFQARNAAAYEIELLVAPSRASTLRRADRLRPVPLDEQEWLLLGKPVDHVLVGRDGSPARIVVPDPRWYALQKLWMSQSAKRNPQKRPKDAQQGKALLDTVKGAMPQYPLDAAFEASMPPELQPHYEAWKRASSSSPRPGW